MNRHVGASTTLSVLIVAFFAVVLYQPDPHQPARSPEKPPANSSATDLLSANSGPPPTPGVPLIEASAEAVSAGAEEALDTPSTPSGSRIVAPRPLADRALADEPVVSKVPNTSLVRVEVPSRPVATESSAPIQTVSQRRPVAPAPRSAFTQVGKGESLTDVAVRIYGSPEAVRNLWMANRDIIDDQNSPLRNGTLLRTP